MSDTAAAIRAAKEVQADTLVDTPAPALYREAVELFSKAQADYKFKNFMEAKEYADKARYLAEQAEFQALSKGANRVEVDAPPPPLQPTPAPSYSYPAPTPTAVEDYDKKHAEDEAAEKQAASPTPTSPSQPTPALGFPPPYQLQK